MIRFISGLPGAGKTAYAVWQVMQELRRTKRPIVTNMALRLEPWIDGAGKPREGLLGAMRAHYGDTYDAERRIVLLEDEQVRRFYLCRPVLREGRKPKVHWLKAELNGKEIEETHADWKKARFRLRKGTPGVCYFIDEVHEFYQSRDWQTTGKVTLSWASQQRRAGDDAWFLTQVAKNVEVQLRAVSQECYWFTNHAFVRAMLWRHPDVISYAVYSTTPPGPTEKAQLWGKTTYPRERVRASYDTAAGVGVEGTGADLGKRAGGLPLWSLAVGVMLFFFAVAWGVNWVMGYGGRKAREMAGLNARGRQGTLEQTVMEHMSNNPPSAPTVVTQTIVQVREPLASQVPKRDPIPFVGLGQVGRVTVLELETGGIVYGVGAIEEGDRVLMEGLEYIRVKKRD